MPEISIERAINDERLFGAALGDLSSWRVWLTVLKAAFALALSNDEAALFKAVAGNRAPPGQRVRELWAVVGRRGGKSRIAALIAVYLALFVRYTLSPGERAMVLCLAATQEQANVVLGYVVGLLQASPALAGEIVSIKRGEVTLRNGIVIAVHSNSFRTVRGRTLVAAVLDEVSFWRDETSATPDIEAYRALMPSLATTRGMCVAISSPYRRIGLLHQKHRDHYGQDGDTLVVQGASQVFNPSLSDETIATQRAADPLAASSEWDALFRVDVSSYLDDALIEAAVEPGRPLELPPLFGFAAPVYSAFTDSAGGVGSDSYTFSIGHREDDAYVVHLVRGTEGIFNPQEVTKQYAELCQQYHLTTVTGDHYAASWVSSAWAEAGVSYVRSELNKSAIYLECLPLFARGLVRLPDHPKLLRELPPVGAPHPPQRQGYRRSPQEWPRRPCQRGLWGCFRNCPILDSMSAGIGYQVRTIRSVPRRGERPGCDLT